MYDELTEVDIKKMREELDHRIRVLRPQLIEEVQTARAFGDLSENFEYKCAKQEKKMWENKNYYGIKADFLVYSSRMDRK